MKKASVVLSTLILLSSVAGCTATNETTARETRNDDTDVTIVQSDEPDETDVTDPSDTVIIPMIPDSELKIDYVPEDHGRVIPFLAVYEEDEWMPEGNRYTYGLIDLDGNQICDAVFDSVISCDEWNCYIVRSTQGDVTKYGLLSYDGSKFSGLVYDGLYNIGFTGKNGECFYGSVYSEGNIWVKYIDQDFNEILARNITIDEKALGLDAASAQLTVRYMGDGRAFLFNKNEFYPNDYLIDTSNGKVLYQSSALEMTEGKLYGNVIVEQEADGQGIKVYDMDGNLIVDDSEAYSWQVCPDRYMIAADGTLSLHDREWKIVASMEIPKDAIVMSSFGKIAIGVDLNTKLYDKDLNLITEHDDIYLGDGTYFRDWYGFGDGDMYFDSISYANTVYNLSTGARISKEDGFFYSFKYGYIMSDNGSNGNDPVKKWRVYDGDFNPVMSGTGNAYMTQDEATGEVYLYSIEDGKMTVYSLTEGEELFSLDNFCYNLRAYDGRFYGFAKYRFFLADDSGSVLFDYEVDHRIIRGI